MGGFSRDRSLCSGRQLTYPASFAVATVMFSTSTLIAIQMVYVKHLPVIVAVAFFLIFGFFDGEACYTSSPPLVPHRTLGLFWGAALKKIPHASHVFNGMLL